MRRDTENFMHVRYIIFQFCNPRTHKLSHRVLIHGGGDRWNPSHRFSFCKAQRHLFLKKSRITEIKAGVHVNRSEI